MVSPPPSNLALFIQTNLAFVLVFLASDKKTGEVTDEPIKDDQFTFDKENINRSNATNTNYSNSNAPVIASNNNSVTGASQNETDKLASFKSSLNRVGLNFLIILKKVY